MLFCSWSRLWKCCSYWGWTELSSIRPAAALKHSAYWTTTHRKVEYVLYMHNSVVSPYGTGNSSRGTLSIRFLHLPYQRHCVNSVSRADIFPAWTSFLQLPRRRIKSCSSVQCPAFQVHDSSVFLELFTGQTFKLWRSLLFQSKDTDPNSNYRCTS